MSRYTMLLVSIFVLQSPCATAAWTSINSGVDCDLTAVDFSDSSNGFTMGAQGCGLSTHDGGTSWQNAPTNIIETVLSMHMADTQVLYGARVGLYRSINGGGVWEPVGNLADYFGSVFDMHFTDTQHLVLIKGEDILISDDAGSTYRLALYKGSSGYVNKLYFPTPRIGYAMGGITYESGSYGSILKSIDGGRSWKNVTPPEISQVMLADFIDANNGIALTFNNEVLKTSDGGVTWGVIKNTVLPLTAITCLRHWDDNHWYVATATGQIFESYDAGTHWLLRYSDPDKRMFNAMTFAAGRAIAVGDRGLIVRETH